MPIYEYRCTRCGHRFERLQPVGSFATTCPQCGGSTRRLLGSVGLVFRGSGFYTTDYRRSQNGGSKSEQSTEAKTDPKKESKSASA